MLRPVTYHVTYHITYHVTYHFTYHVTYHVTYPVTYPVTYLINTFNIVKAVAFGMSWQVWSLLCQSVA